MAENVADKVETALAPGDVPAEEKKLVAQWDKQLMHARKGDKAFRERVVRDRKYASGEALEGFEVSTNLVQATIDTLIPFLYAKDPDVDAVPQDQVSAPIKPRLSPPQPPMGAVDPAGQPLMAPDGQPISPDPEQFVQFALQMAEYQAVQAEREARAEADRERNDFLRRFAQTIEIVISRLWKKARLKAAMKPALRSSMTSSEGWLKVSLQGDILTNPTVQQELYTLQQLSQSASHLAAMIASGECQDEEAARAQLQAKEEGLQAKLETYIARCLVADWVDTLDMQWPLSLRTISEYTSAPWGADATYYTLDDAVSRFELDKRFPDAKKKLASAARFEPPQGNEELDPTTVRELGNYSKEAEGWTKLAPQADGFVRVWEINAKCDNMVYTWIDGTDFWAKPPQPPRFQTTRFYPYFLIALYEVDGARHSQSLAFRLHKLQNEFCVTRSSQAEVKRRGVQGIIFDSTNITPEDAKRIEESTGQEFVGIAPVRAGEPVSNSFAPKPHNSPDPGLYETNTIRADMEAISGAQDALRGGMQTAKTATEAEIEAAGSTARTGYSRDALDDMLNEVAPYCAELALQAFTPEQVKTWAGPHAVWPQGIDSEKLESLVHVAIRAGSSGKPNTSAERAAWAAIAPILNSTIERIGVLQGSDPGEIADKLKEVLFETIHRTGDKLDGDRFLPMPGSNQGGAPMGAPPVSPAGPMPAPSPAAVPTIP